jgi:hypothetical protein
VKEELRELSFRSRKTRKGICFLFRKYTKMWGKKEEHIFILINTHGKAIEQINLLAGHSFETVRQERVADYQC